MYENDRAVCFRRTSDSAQCGLSKGMELYRAGEISATSSCRNRATTAPNYDIIEGIDFICVPSTPPSTPTRRIPVIVTSNSASNSTVVEYHVKLGILSVNRRSYGGSITLESPIQGILRSLLLLPRPEAGGQGGQAVCRTPRKHSNPRRQSLTNSGNSSATRGNGNNSDNSTYIVPRQVASAIAPSVAPTVPCFKGYSGGGQSATFGFSFGSGKIDQNCSRLESSRLAPSLVARCKIFITVKWAKQAGVTMEDCLGPIGPTQVGVAVPEQVNPAVARHRSYDESGTRCGCHDCPPPPPVVAPAQNIVKAAQVNAKRYHIHRKPPCKCVVTNDNIK